MQTGAKNSQVLYTVKIFGNAHGAPSRSGLRTILIRWERKIQAAQIVLTYPPVTWVRAYFSGRSKSWMADNNLSESFNAWIGDFRCLPIII